MGPASAVRYGALMPFVYARTVHFSDTDAAGVMFFANYLAVCHEAYEEALGAAGINLKNFFSDHGVVVPIAKSEAEYLRPLACGDKLAVDLTVQSLSANSFALHYELTRLAPPAKCAARVRTEHICIDSATRARKVLPGPLATWVTSG